MCLRFKKFRENKRSPGRICKTNIHILQLRTFSDQNIWYILISHLSFRFVAIWGWSRHERSARRILSVAVLRNPINVHLFIRWWQEPNLSRQEFQRNCFALLSAWYENPSKACDFALLKESAGFYYEGAQTWFLNLEGGFHDLGVLRWMWSCKFDITEGH